MKYIVWVGGTEVEQEFDNLADAEAEAWQWLADGYDDVLVVQVERVE